MAHGCILGTTKGPLVIFEKEFSKVTSQVYSQYVVPGLHKHTREMKHKGGFLRAIIMEDNASVHTARATVALHNQHHVIRMV